MLTSREIMVSSLAAVNAKQDELVADALARLRGRFPEFAALVESIPLSEQERQFGELLVEILDHADDPVWFACRLPPIGQKHALLGVQPEMYGWACGCVVDAIKERAGDAWSSDTDATWRATLALASVLLFSGHSMEDPRLSVH